MEKQRLAAAERNNATPDYAVNLVNLQNHKQEAKPITVAVSRALDALSHTCHPHCTCKSGLSAAPVTLTVHASQYCQPHLSPSLYIKVGTVTVTTTLSLCTVSQSCHGSDRTSLKSSSQSLQALSCAQSSHPLSLHVRWYTCTCTKSSHGSLLCGANRDISKPAINSRVVSSDVAGLKALLQLDCQVLLLFVFSAY